MQTPVRFMPSRISLVRERDSGQCVPDCDPTASDCCVYDTDCDDGAGTCTTDCTTNDDGDGLVDCLDTCIDSDGDGYGAPGGAGNTCTGSDCDDVAAPTCNVDCTTDADNDGTRDCEDTCLDEDGDGYGDAGGGGNTCTGADCDDDPSGCGVACNAGAVEICDNQDNDCANGVDDGLGAPCACTGPVVTPPATEDCDTGTGKPAR